MQLKSSAVRKVCSKIDNGWLPLHFLVPWLFSSCSGAAAKFARPLLQRWQHGDDLQLDGRDKLVLSTLRAMAAMACLATPRDIDVWSAKSSRPFVYSDAFWSTPTLPSRRWVILGLRSAPLGGTCAVPAEVVQDWIPRRQQIFPGEALCLNIFPVLQPELFQGSDLLWVHR